MASARHFDLPYADAFPAVRAHLPGAEEEVPARKFGVV